MLQFSPWTTDTSSTDSAVGPVRTQPPGSNFWWESKTNHWFYRTWMGLIGLVSTILFLVVKIVLCGWSMRELVGSVTPIIIQNSAKAVLLAATGVNAYLPPSVFQLSNHSVWSAGSAGILFKGDVLKENIKTMKLNPNLSLSLERIQIQKVKTSLTPTHWYGLDCWAFCL